MTGENRLARRDSIQSLLNIPKTAFLASSTVPVEMVLTVYEWAGKMRDEGRCVISSLAVIMKRMCGTSSSVANSLLSLCWPAKCIAIYPQTYTPYG